MKKTFYVILAVMLSVAGISLLAGCSKKEEPVVTVNEQSRELLRQGVVYLKQGDPSKAAMSFAGAVKASPDYFEAYYMLASLFIELKQYDQALAVLSTSAKRFPTNPVVYYLQAVAHQGAGNMMPSIVSARKSLDFFQAKKDVEGEKRAKLLLGALVQLAKKSSEAKMLADAEQDAASAGKIATP
ncbi:MAG: tetratricopeptide repeat protein [Candidatus Omnitrophota bacterium]